MIHRELPFYWILLFLDTYRALIYLRAYRYMLSKQSTSSYTYENVHFYANRTGTISPIDFSLRTNSHGS